MNRFEYYSPTKIVFGRDAERQTGKEIKAFAGSRVFIVHTDSAEKTGLLKRVTDGLENDGLAYMTCAGVRPNPRLQFARNAVKKALGFGADFILAVGGGSAIDTAKAVAHGVANPQADIWDFWMKKSPLEKSTPVGVILTIAASGSETSESAVLTDEGTMHKQGFDSPWNRPKFAIMDPELTFTLPKFQVACGIVDMMMHTMDRYFTCSTGNDLTDAIAEALLRTVIKNGRTAYANPRDYHAMSELMWCASVSHSGLTGLGARLDFAPHALSRELGARYDVAHGASLAAVWGSWARYSYRDNPKRFAQYAREVWWVDGMDDEAAAVLSIQKTEEFFVSLGMPVSFTTLGIGILGNDTLKELAYECCDKGTRLVGSFKELAETDLYSIYSMANR